MNFNALTDRPTPINLTNHSYFNLAGHDAGSQQLYNHQVQFCANQYTPTNSKNIPTGELVNVDDTVFDFRSETRLGDVIHKVPGGGYDHNFVVSESSAKFDNTLPLAAKFWHPESGRKLEIFTDQPGFQVYTGNAFPADGSLVGKNGTVYSRHGGLAVEPQNFPNAINQVMLSNNFKQKSKPSFPNGSWLKFQPNFPDSVLRPGSNYRRTIVYKFSIQ